MVGIALTLFGVGCSPTLVPVSDNSAAQSTPMPKTPPTETEASAAPPPFDASPALLETSDPEALFQLILAEQEKYQRKLNKLQFTSRWEVNWVMPGHEKKLVHEGLVRTTSLPSGTKRKAIAQPFDLLRVE